MKKVIMGVVLGICIFIAGIMSAVAYFGCFMAEDLANDIGKFAAEAAVRAYDAGKIDGENGDSFYYEYNDLEEIEAHYAAIDYTYIK